MCNMTIWRRTDILIIEASKPTNEHVRLTDDYPIGDCMPNVLIDDDDLSDSEGPVDDYEDDCD